MVYLFKIFSTLRPNANVYCGYCQQTNYTSEHSTDKLDKVGRTSQVKRKFQQR